MFIRKELLSSLLIFHAWLEERQRRTGKHIFQKDRKAIKGDVIIPTNKIIEISEL